MSGRTVSVNYATVNGTATAGSDYTAKSGTLTFDPGVTSLPLSVSVLGDTAQEQDETFTIGLSAPQNVTLPGTSPTVTILDDDRLQVTLSANRAFPLAAGQSVTWTATATRGTAPYTFQFAIYHAALGTWRTMQVYSATNTFTYTPYEAGSYQVRVWARNSGSANAYDDEAVSSTFTQAQILMRLLDASVVLICSSVLSWELGFGCSDEACHH